MNRLREMRLVAGLKQTEIATKLRKQEPRIDAAMISRYESGVCLPTVVQLEQLELLLKADRMELYEPEDLDLLGVGHLIHKQRRKDRRSKRMFRKCFRLSRELERQLPEDLIQTLGFASWQSWFECQIHRMIKAYAWKKRTQTMGPSHDESWIKQRFEAAAQVPDYVRQRFVLETASQEPVPYRDWPEKEDDNESIDG